jgi:tRNA(Arg) A34 adenosine deaminase TadA
VEQEIALSAQTHRIHIQALMANAVDIAVRHVESGGLPFVGVLVGDDGWVSEAGVNLVRETGDPTAHAEIVAIRQAVCERPGGATGAALLATGEPCATCYRVAAAHGVSAVYYAVDRHTAAESGFDYRAGYSSADRSHLQETAQQLGVSRRLAPFTRYLELRSTRSSPSTQLR